MRIIQQTTEAKREEVSVKLYTTHALGELPTATVVRKEEAVCRAGTAVARTHARTHAH